MLAACLNTDLYKDSHKMHHACKMWLTAYIMQYLHALTIIILVSFFSLSEYCQDNEVLDNVDFLLLRKSLKKIKRAGLSVRKAAKIERYVEKKYNHQKR